MAGEAKAGGAFGVGVVPLSGRVPRRGRRGEARGAQWYEADLVLHSEFRDGNVPAGYQRELPLPAMEMGSRGWYKVFGLVTNRELPGEEIIEWSRQRCGTLASGSFVWPEDTPRTRCCYGRGRGYGNCPPPATSPSVLTKHPTPPLHTPFLHLSTLPTTLTTDLVVDLGLVLDFQPPLSYDTDICPSLVMALFSFNSI